MKTLSKRQLQVLGSTSNKAHRHLCGCGLEELSGYEAWRHGFTFDVCGIDSWRQLEQKHYIPLLNAFRRVLGLPPVADRTPKNDEASMLWTIRDRAAHWELSTAYVAAIVRDKFNRPWATGEMTLEAMLAGLGYRELRDLLYTLEARGRARSKKEAAALGVPPPQEVHASRSTAPPTRLAAWRGDKTAEQ